jgi:hypothetical protein
MSLVDFGAGLVVAYMTDDYCFAAGADQPQAHALHPYPPTTPRDQFDEI